jgi:hypothetical protein
MALSPRIWLLGALLVALVLGGAAYACGPGSATGGQASPEATPPAALSPPAGAQTESSAMAHEPVDVLAAVVVARRVCALVDRGSFSAARWLFAEGAHWPKGLWRTLRHVHFRSARVVAVVEGTRSLVHLNVRVATPTARRGVRVLSFTLGRDPTSGQWLVHAVGTPIPPPERGPSCSPSPPSSAAASAAHSSQPRP